MRKNCSVILAQLSQKRIPSFILIGLLVFFIGLFEFAVLSHGLADSHEPQTSQLKIVLYLNKS